MKLKYFAILTLGAFAVTSCSDDDASYNTNKEVTVEFADAAIRVSEDQATSSSYSYIPVVINGETNGPLQITIEVAPCGEAPAVADENYVFTTYTLNVPAGETQALFQYYPKSNDEINTDRTFEIKIADVKGAKVGATASTVVTLVDNEGLIPTYYNGLAGDWNGILVSAYDGPMDTPFTIETVAEGQDGYGKKVTLIDFPAAGMSTQGTFSVDGVTQEIFVSLPSGQTVAQLNHPKYGVGAVLLYPLAGTSYTSSPYNFMLKFNFDLKSGEYVIDPEWNFGMLVSFAAGMMLYDEITEMQFSR